ncbi:hypothetical protein KO361_03195 [Candidatus Woesearchaeota archaeon]|nr:hypothetical protein [Candidatus Woesearchaeota archaeon]
MKSTLKLFKALPVKGNQKPSENLYKELLKQTIEKGFVFSPEVVADYNDYKRLIKLTEEIIGMSGEQANMTFHKSWRKVKEVSIEQLVIEQLIHYFTTYGFERLGIYDSDSVYIPNEVLEIPELKEGITLTIIKGLTKKELKSKLMTLLNSGIALKEDTIQDVIDVALYVGVNEKDIEKINNREVKIILYEYLNILPENPVEFLRYVVYVATNETLLIKSKSLIDKIRESKNVKVVRLFQKYDLTKLAEIFFRYKPIFLAFRTNQTMKTLINKLRKLANEYHKPMPEDYLNSITAKIKNNISINIKELENYLEKVTTFRKIRLAYALKFRTKKDIDSILYRIRNGKSYADSLDIPNKEKYRIFTQQILDIVIDSIIKDLNVKGKKIYIPEFIHYALPTTEKQFTGNFPSGTYVELDRDMVFGINWKNIQGHRIDLDMSLISEEGKFGWDSFYRNENRTLLFSGDVTNAPRGATELFYVSKTPESNYIVNVNYFNYNKDVPVPYKIVVGKENSKNMSENRMVDPNNIVAITNSEIKHKQNIIGLLTTNGDKTRFYFAETSIGNTITSGLGNVANWSRKYLLNYYTNSINFKDILIKAGAKLVEKEKCEIDLSPENIDKNTFIDLLK